jgi:hypothetical protein
MEGIPEESLADDNGVTEAFVPEMKDEIVERAGNDHDKEHVDKSEKKTGM